MAAHLETWLGPDFQFFIRFDLAATVENTDSIGFVEASVFRSKAGVLSLITVNVSRSASSIFCKTLDENLY